MTTAAADGGPRTASTNRDGPTTLTVAVRAGISRIVLNHPPLNLFDVGLARDLMRAVRVSASDPAVKVVVVSSATPGFFIAHADVTDLPPQTVPSEASLELSFFHRLAEMLRGMPKLTVAVVEGRARGAGNELLAAFDLRFASRERAFFGQPELPLGAIPGGGGTQRLPRLIGKARTLELLVGGFDIDAPTAELWGLVNRALPDANLWPYVNALATRVASLPAAAIEACKNAVSFTDAVSTDGLLHEQRLFDRCLESPEVRRRIARFLELGGQTEAVERDLPSIYPGLAGMTND